MMGDNAAVVVFDFDLTLTHWDTTERFFRWLLGRDIWRLGLVLVATPLLGPLSLFGSTRQWLIRYAVWIATLCRSEQRLQALVREHVDAVLAAGDCIFLEAGLDDCADT